MNLRLLDIRFQFFCRTTYANKAGLSPIVLRISYRGKRADVFSGLYCSADSWSNGSQRVVATSKMAGAINRHIDEMLHRCKERFEEMKYSGISFTLDELVMRLKGTDEVLVTILDYLNKKVEELKGRVGIDITPATLQKYKRCIQHILEFVKFKYRSSDIAVGAITNSFIKEFFYYLRSQKNNSHNTSVNYVKCLKTVLMPAIKNGAIQIDPFVGLGITSKITTRGFLSIEEINQLECLNDLPSGIAQALDIFLFACYTGMAYIDIKQFSRKHLIKESDGSICIHKPRQKTGIISIIPLLAPANRILQSYSPTDSPLDFRWTVISNQKINEHLKTIAKIAKIKQDLFFHLARHTFATTITLSNGIPLETVSRMLGHSDIKMTQRYAKISGYKIKEDMKKLNGIFR